MQAARKAAERSKDVPAPSQGRRVAGAWAKGPPFDKENKELSRLRAENAELRQTAKRTENGETSPKEDAENEEEAWPNIAELVSAVKLLEKAMGPNHNLVEEAKTELEAARKKRDEAKPMRNKISNFERKVGKQRRSAEAAATKAEDLRKAANEAERKTQEATRARDDLQRELASAEQELLRMRQVEIQGASEPSANALGDNILGALHPEAVKAATNVEEQELLQQTEIIMARVRKQGDSGPSGGIAAEQTAVPAPALAASAAERRVVDSSPMQLEDVGELERQAIIFERQAEHARERVETAKKARVN